MNKIDISVPAVIFLVAQPAMAQSPLPGSTSTPSPIVTAVRLSQAPRIDGVLNEDVWRDVAPITDFVQRWPVDGSPASERTEVRVAFDGDHLYFGITLFDREPDRILASVLQREGPLGERDDRFIIALDSYHDRRNAYIFELNPLGTQGDALITDEQLRHSDWNWEGVYRSEGSITADGWVLEVAIPFTTIRFSADDAPEMGIAFYRHIQRKSEEATWPAIPLDYRWGIFQVSRYATLAGLSDIERGNSVEVKPFGIFGGQSFDGGHTEDLLQDAGVDIKWGLTSSLTLDLTVNTDFAQVEADNVQINLTRFSLFFPEKREFFLERAGLFTFGDPRFTEVFFSRQVGIENDIFGGARLTGQVGDVSVGLLSLQTEDGDNLPGGNSSVARFRGDVLPRTTVGGIITNLETSSGYSRTAGADLSVRFLGSSSFSAWVARVWSPADLTGSAAGAFEFELRNDLLSFESEYNNVGENFDPALGFVRRTDLVRYNASVGYSPRFDDSWARQLSLGFGASLIDGHDGVKQTHGLRFTSNLRLQSGDNIRFSLGQTFERLRLPFFIRAVTEIPPGDFTFNRATAAFSTTQRRPVSARAELSFGDFFNGTRTSIGGGGLVRFSSHLSLGGNLSHNSISLPVSDGDFRTTVFSINVEAAASRKLFARALIQYDNVSETLQANIRINWIHTPGSDLFLVLDTGYFTGDDLSDFHGSRWVRRTGVAKLTYLAAI